MTKYRIKEEKYKSGIIKFFTEICIDNDDIWKSLSSRVLGFNNNGTDYCKTYNDAKKIIDEFRICLISNGNDNIMEEKFYIIS